MSKVQWKPGNMLYPLPAVIVTCGENINEYNAITIAWCGTICTEPAMTYISVKPTRHSYSIIKKQMGFVINLTTEEIAYETDYVGVRSGANENKLDMMKLDYDLGEIVKSPLLKKSPVCIECKVIEIKELGSHHMFIAEVVKVHVEDSYIDENNKFYLDRSNPIVYSHGQYYGLGENLGRFGHSVMKRKKKKEYKHQETKKKTSKQQETNKKTFKQQETSKKTYKQQDNNKQGYKRSESKSKKQGRK